MRAAGGSLLGAATPNASRKEEAALATPMIAQYLGDQGGQCRLPLVLSHGRFLRAVLRRRGNRLARARHRAHQARQASGRGHSHVRRAGHCRRRLPPAADRRGAPRRRLRADRGPGGGQEARTEGGGAPRRRAPRHPGHADRGDAARCARAQFSHRSVPRPCQAGQRAGLRARLSRHLHRRTDRLVGRRQRSFRRACAAEARRSAGRRRSRRRCRAAPPDRGGWRRAHAVSPRAFRFATRRARPEATARRDRARCVRRIHQGGTCGARRSADLCRDHPGRQSAAAPRRRAKKERAAS